MMNGREKSDPAIVAGKRPNEAGRPAEEAVEPRAGAEENAQQPHTCRAQNRASVSHGPERVRQASLDAMTSDPRQEPYAGKPHVRICAGGVP
jgi:hypothetical protein